MTGNPLRKLLDKYHLAKTANGLADDIDETAVVSVHPWVDGAQRAAVDSLPLHSIDDETSIDELGLEPGRYLLAVRVQGRAGQVASTTIRVAGDANQANALEISAPTATPAAQPVAFAPPVQAPQTMGSSDVATVIAAVVPAMMQAMSGSQQQMFVLLQELASRKTEERTTVSELRELLEVGRELKPAPVDGDGGDSSSWMPMVLGIGKELLSKLPAPTGTPQLAGSQLAVAPPTMPPPAQPVPDLRLVEPPAAPEAVVTPDQVEDNKAPEPLDTLADMIEVLHLDGKGDPMKAANAVLTSMDAMGLDIAGMLGGPIGLADSLLAVYELPEQWVRDVELKLRELVAQLQAHIAQQAAADQHPEPAESKPTKPKATRAKATKPAKPESTDAA